MTPDAPYRETISIPKAVARLGISRRTIYNWIDAGKVDYIRSAGGAIRLFTDTLFRTADHRRLPKGQIADAVRHPDHHA